MPKSRPLTIEEVSQLGAEQLARMLLQAAEDDPALMRTVRIVVASRTGAAEAAAQIDAEIKRVKRSQASIDLHRASTFARDLTALRDAIEGPLADADPVMALERMFDFIDLAPSVGRGSVIAGVLLQAFDGHWRSAASRVFSSGVAKSMKARAFRGCGAPPR